MEGENVHTNGCRRLSLPHWLSLKYSRSGGDTWPDPIKISNRYLQFRNGTHVPWALLGVKHRCSETENKQQNSNNFSSRSDQKWFIRHFKRTHVSLCAFFFSYFFVFVGSIQFSGWHLIYFIFHHYWWPFSMTNNSINVTHIASSPLRGNKKKYGFKNKKQKQMNLRAHEMPISTIRIPQINSTDFIMLQFWMQWKMNFLLRWSNENQQRT